MKFKYNFTEKEVDPKYWNIKDDIIETYLTLCKKTIREPEFNIKDPIKKIDFDIAVYDLETFGAMWFLL